MTRSAGVASTPSRRYPPLLIAVAAIVVAVLILPSSLKLQQANPSETEQFAPVPPSDHPQANPVGNLTSLSLGSSATLGLDGTGGTGPGGNGLSQPSPVAGGPALPPLPSGAGAVPTEYDCVGDPPRQTEDVMSPPCVAYYHGNNGGATFQGVTAAAIRVVLYVNDPEELVGGEGVQEPPFGSCVDLSKPADSSEYWAEAARIWQLYFNYRYATYNRRVLFTICYATKATSVEAVQADAADEYARYKPFADVLLSSGVGDLGNIYVAAMAARGVLSFGLGSELPAADYASYAGYVWTYQASLDLHAQLFASYVCTKVVGHPVSFGGNDTSKDTRLHDGQPRRLGILSTTDPNWPTDQEFAKLVTADIKACGGDVVATGHFPTANVLAPPGGAEEEAADTNMSHFEQDGVTTIIWAEGFDEGTDSEVAATIGYTPEWVLAGDSSIDDFVAAKYESSAELRHFWAVTSTPLQGNFDTQTCYVAAHKTDPQLGYDDSTVPCFEYDGLRQLFTGIQVAGPDLTPQSVDEGFHAIPSHTQSSPELPACFYLVNDYSCVKDAAAMWYDSSATSSYSATPGCWRDADRGARYQAGQWPAGDVLDMQRPADPCNNTDAGDKLDPSPGPGAPFDQ